METSKAHLSVRMLEYDLEVVEAALVDVARLLDKMEKENAKLRSMCIAAAEEIETYWDAHCDDAGCGPINLVDRLKGVTAPYLYDNHQEK